jgi:hypothetical protein
MNLPGMVFSVGVPGSGFTAPALLDFTLMSKVNKKLSKNEDEVASYSSLTLTL